jgi:hypothetical protein
MNNENTVLKTQFLSPADFDALFEFEQQTSDSEGYSLPKEEVKRLCELGVLQNHGFGRYSVTSFGSWIIETEFNQSPSLPLKTAREYNDLQKAELEKLVQQHGLAL